MKWRWLIGVPLFLAGAGCSALMGLAHMEATEQYNEHRAQLGEKMKKHGDAFRADLRTASSLAFLQPSAHKSDAGPFFAKLLAPEKLPLVPPQVERKLDDVVKGKFPSRALEIDVSSVDTSWMKELAQFDHWEIADERPVRFHNVESNPSVRPKFGSVVRARLLQGIHAGDVKTAGREVERLATLVATTEVWDVAATSTHLMELVRHTYEYARAEGLHVEGWDEPPTRKELDAARRALRAYVAALDFHVDPAWHGDLLTSPELATWRCVALNETAVITLEIEPISGARYREGHDWIERAMEATKGQCRLTLAREAWGKEGQGALVVGSDALCNPDSDAGGCVAASIGTSFPGIRDLPIESFTTSAPALFNEYDTKPR